MNELTRKSQYIALADKVGSLIKNGTYEKGAKLPSVRQFAASEGISHITANKVFVQLEKNGLIERVHGSGSFVIYTRPFDNEDKITKKYVKDQFDLMKSSQQSRTLLVSLLKNTTHICPYNFSYALLSPELINGILPPVHTLLEKTTLSRVYGDMKGSYKLRAELLEHYSVNGKVDNACITNGNQHGISLIAQLLIDPGDAVLIENPTYTGAVDIFKNRGANLVGINIHEAGFDIKAIEGLVKKHRPKLMFLTPNYSNPTGYLLSSEEKQSLIQLSKAYNFFIVEDDHWSELSEEGPACPFYMLEEVLENVIGLRGFSKIIGPDLRIGVLFANEKLVAEVEKLLTMESLGVSSMAQEYLYEVIRGGFYDRMVKQVNKDLIRRRAVVVRALAPLKGTGIKYDVPKGGINIWIELPESINAESFLIKTMFKEGITFLPGALCGVHSIFEYAHCLRLNYTFLPMNSLKAGLSKFVHMLIEETKTMDEVKGG